MQNLFNFCFGLVVSALHLPISGNPSDATVSEGKDVIFTCSIDLESVLPFPSSATWSFVRRTDNQPETLEETGSSRSRIRKLHLTSVSRSDAGTYQCVIKNEFGAISSSMATLTVQCKS